MYATKLKNVKEMDIFLDKYQMKFDITEPGRLYFLKLNIGNLRSFIWNTH